MSKDKGGIILDAAMFNSKYIAKDAMTKFLKVLPQDKIEELSKLITHFKEFRKIVVKPTKRKAENGEYHYNSVEFKGKNGTIPFFPTYHPDFERFIMDYLSGDIIVSFKLEDIYDSKV